MEYEVRYYYPISKMKEIEEILSKFKELKKSLRTYEKTIQFNHCDERYRTTYSNEDIEISIDEYPFGLALEIENKSTDKDPMEVVADWTKKMNLDINNSYRLSWDDKYKELCNEQGKEVFSEVAFDKDMPEIK